ncbi:hypothetical protein [Paracoccus laeviglucosivorans]|uniref:Uncharacterized protein n=1 Tax=Paracoccus laeviglucosivorans TaxID=1197861 RepID=A0A521FUT4_9RHOB|nr:hypothetical protein [Paracoccus laeviglucosivorans]SMO99933.1 hypothetical protein SAMN06265221_15211 [Paracoccus laeviglucosivorans]
MGGPKHSDEYDDRFLDCEADLEADILAVLDSAAAAGWKRAEALAAITSLIDNVALGDQAKTETQRKIDEAMQRLRD